MSFLVKSFTKDNAIALCQWKYEEPYTMYNCPDWNVVVKKKWGMTEQKKRDLEFFSVYENNSFIGYFRLVKKENAVILGLGLHPSYCGQGLGKSLLKLIINTANERYGNTTLHLEVRQFNERAIRCYERVGFVKVKVLKKETLAGSIHFLLMEYKKEKDV